MAIEHDWDSCREETKGNGGEKKIKSTFALLLQTGGIL